MGGEQWLGKLALALKEETNRADSIRRVFIPKANGKRPPLGISTVRGRVCTTAAMLMLEPIFEADLPPEQYACRPGRNAQQAVVEAEKMLFRGRSVARCIIDRRVLHLIKQWLECSVDVTDRRGRKKRTTEAKDSRCGTPEGAPLRRY